MPGDQDDDTAEAVQALIDSVNAAAPKSDTPDVAIPTL